MKNLYKLFSIFERYFAYAQGKGYHAPLEKEVDLLFSSIGGEASIAIDIGGNIGSYTEELLKRNPNMNIHIFEPSQTNIQILNSKFIHNVGVIINPLAASETTGTATLFSNKPGSGLGSLSKRRLDHFNIDFEITESISTIRFEEYWSEKLNSSEIDLVKIDVEGCELEVLQGAVNYLKRSEFPPIFFESWEYEWYREKKEALFRFLNSIGYKNISNESGDNNYFAQSNDSGSVYLTFEKNASTGITKVVRHLRNNQV